MESIIGLLLTIWQMPQNIAGLIKYGATRVSRVYCDKYDMCIYFCHKVTGVTVLGRHIFVNDSLWRTDSSDFINAPNIKKGLELSRISRISGPFYFLVLLVMKLKNTFCSKV